MTTTEPVPGPVTPVRRTWSAWRTLLVILGSLLILLGGGLLLGGGVGLWAHAQRDGDGYHMAGPERLSTDTYALSAPSLDVSMTGPDSIYADDLLGDVKLQVESTSAARPLFIGIGPATDVARYLADVKHTQVADIDADPFKVTYVPRPGGQPTTDPATQTFWVASDTGTGERTLNWDVADGNWSVLVMNADGSQGVDADVSVGGTLPVILPVSIGALIGGGVLLILGIAIIVVTVATRPSVFRNQPNQTYQPNQPTA